MPNYLIVDNVIAAQTPTIEEIFLKILHEFDNIIEIGFHRGGFSLWLYKNKKIETELFCFDITFNHKEVDNENINFILGDCFEENTKNKIKEIIQKKGKTLLLCDGGKKNEEFNTFSSYLKSGDVIMCHDYSENLNDYSELSEKINWPHPSESNYLQIKNFIELNNLQPFLYEEFKNVLWGSFIKK
jgi:hypothetical protein